MVVTWNTSPTGASGNSTRRNHCPLPSAVVVAVAFQGEVTVTVAPGAAVPEYSS